jgi:predicted nucleic acid-binding protein
MVRGLDTTFLVEAEVAGHPHHVWARAELDAVLSRGDSFAIAPQVLAEFIHVVTDPKRFSMPLRPEQALTRAETWWQAEEVVRVFPSDDSCALFLEWMRTYELGRKRILDTLLAATYYAYGIRSILSSNARDYAVFGCFSVICPAQTT